MQEMQEPEPQLPVNLRKRLRMGRAPVKGASEQELYAMLESLDWSRRAEAVQALGAQGEHAPVERIIEALEDTHEAVRAVAARALGRLYERAPVAPLLAALSDPSWQCRVARACGAAACSASGRR